MARIPYFDPEQAPERVLRAMAGKRKINIFRMIANSENSAPEVLALGQTLSKGSSLDPAHREVVILRVAHLTNAAYQWHEHTTVAKRVGFTAEKIDAIAAHTSREPGIILSPFERTLIEFTDAVVITATAPDELFDAVRTDYNDSRVVELVLLIGFYMMVARVMNTFHLDLENEKVGSYHLRLD